MTEPMATTESTSTSEFEKALTALSVQYGLGIAGSPVLFIMEQDDYERTYHTDEAGSLVFE